MGFVSAVQTLTGEVAPSYQKVSLPKPRASPPKPFKLPEPNRNNDRVYAYLRGRSIGKEIINRCLKAGLLYESAKTHRCVFVGKDGNIPKFACERGTRDNWKKDIAGSDKRFSFYLPPQRERRTGLAVFEGAVDTLAHYEVCRLRQSKWDGYRLSLGGTSSKALVSFLERNPQIRSVALCLDNDEAGRNATKRIIGELASDKRFSHLRIVVKLPPVGKDYADTLTAMQKQNERTPNRHHQADFSI